MTGVKKLDEANQSDPPGIVRVDRRVRPCPWCGAAAIVDNQFGREWWVQCTDLTCGRSDGRLYETPGEAEEAWNRFGWIPIAAAPRDETTLLLLVPTRRGKWNASIPLAGRWDAGGFWVIFNADEAIQRVEPTHWVPLPAGPNVRANLPP